MDGLVNGNNLSYLGGVTSTTEYGGHFISHHAAQKCNGGLLNPGKFL